MVDILREPSRKNRWFEFGTNLCIKVKNGPVKGRVCEEKN